MKKVFVFIFAIISTFIFPNSVYGQEDIPNISEQDLKVQPMNKGAVAKFDGILFSTALVLKIKLEKEFSAQKCQNEVQYSVEKSVAEWQAKLEKAEAEYDATIKKLQVENQLTRDSLDFCQKKLSVALEEETPWYKNSVFLFSVGFVAGAAVTIAVLYSVNQ